ncbi:MAG: Na+/H+ antiporter subunit E [Vitreimonas sp.]
MTRIVPYPGLSLALGAMWLLLHNSLSPATLAGAVVIGLAAPWSLARLEAPRPRLKSLAAAFHLGAIVTYDIVRSNIAVGSIILGGGRKARTSGFVAIPLDLTNQYGLALLAIIITSTPGTLWAQHDPARDRLMLHVLDLVDEGDWIRLVKQRYEPLLMEMFE